MTRPLPLILLLCCLVGCVSKQKPQTVFYPKAELLTDTPQLIGVDTGSIEYWDYILYNAEGTKLAASKKRGQQWIIEDSAAALVCALEVLDADLKEKTKRPVYILDGDTVTLYPGDTIRIVTCKEDKTYFKTVKN